MAQVVLPQQAVFDRAAPAKTGQHDVHRAFRVIRILVTAIAMVAVLVALLLGTLARASGSGAVRLFGNEVRPILSGSMTPAFRPGDAVITTVATPERIASISAGDIITFRVPGRESMVVAHRVVRVAKDGDGNLLFTTKGDANGSEDDVPVDGAHVIGVVSRSVPYLGRVMNGLEQRRTLFIFLFSAVLAGFSLALARRAKRYADTHDLHLLSHHEEVAPFTEGTPLAPVQTPTTDAHT